MSLEPDVRQVAQRIENIFWKDVEGLIIMTIIMAIIMVIRPSNSNYHGNHVYNRYIPIVIHDNTIRGYCYYDVLLLVYTQF